MKVVISGYYGFGNIGDEAILSVSINLLRSLLPDIEITVLSAKAEKTASLFQVKAISRNDFSLITSEVKKADLFISGGGGLLQDVTSRRSLYYYLALISLAQYYKVPTLLLAQGVGPLTSKSSLKLLSLVLKGVKSISVRDKPSATLLETLGYKGKLLLTADLAFLLKPDYLKGAQVLESLAINNKPYLFLSPSRALDRPSIVESVIQTVLFLKEEYGLEILVVPFYPRHDHFTLELIKNRLKDRAHYVEDCFEPEVALALVGRSEMIFSSRLHPIISAAITEVPFLGISYDPKVDNLAKELGEGLTLPLSKVKPADMIYHSIKIYENRAEIKARLKKLLLPLIERARLNINIIKEFIN
ncbi:MAG: hypothetical protein DDT23_00236 [candidate division WS2 bacterium]|nr:hypothetical protein [Candidatus Lithacetigena glycinireducens]